MILILTAEQWLQRRAQSPAAVLLHVLPEEHYSQQHLPDAVNACVYETAFLDKVQELVPGKTTPVVVYGAGAPSLDSAVAAECLSAAGYADVSDLRGGLAAWTAASLPVEGTGVAVGPALGGRFVLDTEKSLVRWTGRNLFNHHEGTLKFASGSLEVRGGVLTHAEFFVDMRSIACGDITDAGARTMLLRHLAADDFFATEAHPNASFTADRAEALPACTDGTPNYLLHGHITVRGVTKPLSFPAVIAAADEDHLTGQAQFEIDRTKFGSLYGSGRFFAALGKHLVNDHIHLHLKVHAVRKAA